MGQTALYKLDSDVCFPAPFQTFSVYRDFPGGLQSSENAPPPAAQPARKASVPSTSRAPSIPSFAIYSDENSAPQPVAPIQQVRIGFNEALNKITG